MSKELHRRWLDLTSFVAENVREKWWERIASNYGPRHFHGLDHLAAMMHLFDVHKDSLKDRYAVAFAIFFKNLIYDPVKGFDAEENTALLKEFASEATLDQEGYVTDLLMDSGNNCTDAHLNPDQYGSADVHYLIDFDTAWMADDASQYAEHCKGVRKELSHLSDEEYREQRLKVLQLFIQVPNIFATKPFRDQYEAAARRNIEEEIQRLNSQK